MPDMKADDLVAGDLTSKVLACAIEVHRHLGPGMLEAAYRDCLAHQMRLDGLDVLREQPVPINYKGLQIGTAFRADLIVDGRVLVELKCVQAISPVHRAQVWTYLKFLDLRVGLLLNFHERRLPDGIRRIVR
jgi:GxxExxY protein